MIRIKRFKINCKGFQLLLYFNLILSEYTILHNLIISICVSKIDILHFTHYDLNYIGLRVNLKSKSVLSVIEKGIQYTMQKHHLNVMREGHVKTQEHKNISIPLICMAEVYKMY